MWKGMKRGVSFERQLSGVELALATVATWPEAVLRGPNCLSDQPAFFMTVRGEIAEPRRETCARSREDPRHTRAVR